jgi:MFS family permease
LIRPLEGLHRLPRQAKLILTVRTVRVFCDSFIALMIPLYLAARGFDAIVVGVIASWMLLGSALAIGLAGAVVHRLGVQLILCLASVGMVLSGVGWSLNAALPVLMFIAFFGSLNPHGGEVNLFRPMEHTALADLVPEESHTTIFGYYSFLGAIAGAMGALAFGGLPVLYSYLDPQSAMMIIFLSYAFVGCVVLVIYGRMSANNIAVKPAPLARLDKSRGTVLRMTAVFCVDAFGGGFIVNALVILWLVQRFEASLAESGTLFFCAGILAALAQLVAAPISRRIGLGRTMLVGHVPSSLLLIAAGFAPSFALAATCLILRGFLSQLDVPTRTAFVFSHVAPSERAAAISFTLLPFSLAAAVAPLMSGWLLSVSTIVGWPLVAAGCVRLIYALLFWWKLWAL